ncbi:tyrosine-type recombinase/integrase [Kitasatospora sp. NPDC089797]|uniref:tyrosine-type recombinase/integrase n=1 Tax=Kitasatospora sp. NPDC089797 TaxID=3155298 RepID=UPI00343B996B
MSALALRAAGTPVPAAPRDPRDDWPAEARRLREDLAALWGEDDALPDLAGAWIAHHRSANTRRTYARHFRTWNRYCAERGHHPLEAAAELADAFARHLETAPTLVRVRGGAYGETAPTGAPYSDAARANVLSANGGFYRHAVKTKALATGDPFADVLRPPIDPDHCATEGLTQEENLRLVEAARARSKRAYALVLCLYVLFLRVDSLLSADVTDLGYDRGHHVLRIRVKGGKVKRKAVPPIVWHALQDYLDGRTDGPLFTTRTGARLREPEVWKLLRRLARRAGLPQQDSIHPHVLRGDGITDALEAGDKLEDVQDAADHKDPRTTQRYNRRRHRLERHPGHGLAARLADRLATDDSALVDADGQAGVLPGQLAVPVP